jgi:hypothetical protein
MADLKEAFRRLDPASPLDGDLLEAYYVGRPGDPVGELTKRLEYSESPQHILLVGQRGVGKTTELHRLDRSLKTNKLNFLPFLVLDSIGEQVLDYPDKAVNQVLQKLWHQLSQRLKWSKQYSSFSRMDSFGMISGDAAKVRDVISDLKEENFNLVLLLDGMEKLRGQDVRKAASFAAELRRLGCSVIAVVPLALWFSPEFSSEVAEWDRVVTLPAVSIRTRNGAPDEAGRGLLRSVIEQRGCGDLFTEEAIAFVIEQSGGIHRELLTLAQDALLRASPGSQPQITIHHVKASVDERRLTQSSRLTTQFYKALSHVREFKRLDNTANLLQLLELHLVVAYQDSSTWFDVHPVFEPLIDAYV